MGHQRSTVVGGITGPPLTKTLVNLPPLADSGRWLWARELRLRWRPVGDYLRILQGTYEQDR